MLQYSVYSVISPEGCASILWKTSERASDAADALGITAHRLKALGLVDKIVNEPVGGAHRDTKQMAAYLKRALERRAAPGERPRSPRNCWSAATSGCNPTAASATPRNAEAAPLSRSPRRGVAYSGGRDSTRAAALPTARGRQRRAAALDACVALHVHHGLSRARRCLARASASRQCRRWAHARPAAWPFDHRRLAGRPARGESVEAWARRGSLRSAAPRWRSRTGATLVLLAHHRRDQAETLLLQALRGAGLPAWPAMPQADRARRHHLGAAVAGACRRERSTPMHAGTGCAHVDDDSNADRRFARNRLRARCLARAGGGVSAGRGRPGGDARAGRTRRSAVPTSWPPSTWRESSTRVASTSRPGARSRRHGAATCCAPGCGHSRTTARPRRSSSA